jgi:O-antigen ligase
MTVSKPFLNTFKKLLVLSLVLIPATLLCKKFNINSIIIIVAGCLSAIYITLTRERITIKKEFLLLFIIGYFTLLLAFVHKADETANGFAIIQKKLPILVLPFIVFVNKNLLRKHLHAIYKIFIFFTVVACIYCSIKIYGDWLLSEKSFKELFTYYKFTSSYFSEKLDIHPNYLSNFILLCILFINHLFKRVKENWHRLLLVLVWVYLTFIIIQLASRLQILNYAILLIVLFLETLIRNKQKKQYKPILIFLLGSAGVIFLLNSNFVVERFKQGIDMYFDNGKSYPQYHEASRIHTWKHFPKLYLENPVFGAGTGNENERLHKTFINDNYQRGINNKLNYHNQYFQELARSGFIGFIVFCTILTMLIKQSLKQRDFIFILFIAFNLIFFLFESVLERQRGIVFFFFFSSVFYYCNSERASLTKKN